MNETQRPAPAYRNPATLAPSVDRAWADAFVLEQRLLDVPGDRIGDALVTIESHVAESGESAHEAFGDPTSYARELADAMPRTADSPSAVRAATVVSAFAGLVGLLLTNTAFQSWLSGTEVSLSWGHLTAFALTLLILVAIIGWSSSVLRVLVTRVWVTFLALAIVIAVAVGLMVRFPEAAVEGSATAFGAAGLALLAVGAVVGWLDHTEDPVLAPGESPSGGTGARLLGALAMPLATVVVLGFTWVLHLLA